ncbi:NUDIX domain-containing protein [Deinococcus sp. KNUC1210]|uniref:NUDIX domain-containing protein n=1 Tax=Deinococcus sp. KNUC1210 TaxID=2917691 RepID=UPI001EF06B95|nr:NUDIX domain-containing protein [Deinococcus sp. KNUC1210]ULH15897.1 NUDIX domain-containing protein [Deinococcus sp. KNUC1210]
MIRRRDNGRWDLPGGGVEAGEVVEHAARRELNEETGLTAQDLQLLGVFSGPTAVHTYPDGNVVAWVTVLYLCRGWSGVPAPADDACEVGWFAFSSVPGELSKATASYLECVRAAIL